MTYQFPDRFIDRLCDRYLSGLVNMITPDAWDHAWDMIYEACRISGPRAAVREARYWADAFDHD